MAESFAFTARGLAVGYRGQTLIRDISFQLSKGKILTAALNGHGRQGPGYCEGLFPDGCDAGRNFYGREAGIKKRFFPDSCDA